MTATSAVSVTTTGGTILTVFSVKSPTSKKAVKKVAPTTIHKAKAKAKAKAKTKTKAKAKPKAKKTKRG